MSRKHESTDGIKLDKVAYVGTGEYKGNYIWVTKGKNNAGYQIWFSKENPNESKPNETWDVWVDNEEDLRDWFSDELSSISWIE